MQEQIIGHVGAVAFFCALISPQRYDERCGFEAKGSGIFRVAAAARGMYGAAVAPPHAHPAPALHG